MDQDLEQSIPFVPIIVGFFAFLIFSRLLERKLRNRKFLREGQLPYDGTRVPSIEERLAANRAWAAGQIRSAGRGPVIALWLLALVWNLTFGFAFFKSFSNPEIKTAALVVLGIFAVLGVVPLFFAVRFTIRRFRFGDSWCCIRGKAGVLGSVMTGYIRTSTELQVNAGYTIELQCVESYSSGSGKNRRTENRLHWQEKQKVSSGGTSSLSGIPFSFTLPTYAPETGYQLSRGDISWSMKIYAPVQGVDYSAIFSVPVFKMD